MSGFVNRLVSGAKLRVVDAPGSTQSALAVAVPASISTSTCRCSSDAVAPASVSAITVAVTVPSPSPTLISAAANRKVRAGSTATTATVAVPAVASTLYCAPSLTVTIRLPDIVAAPCSARTSSASILPASNTTLAATVPLTKVSSSVRLTSTSSSCVAASLRVRVNDACPMPMVLWSASAAIETIGATSLSTMVTAITSPPVSSSGIEAGASAMAIPPSSPGVRSSTMVLPLWKGPPRWPGPRSAAERRPRSRPSG